MIGAGGMATVYLASDQKHRRPVAIKVFHAELASVVGGERFLREIEIAAGLTHPHILSLYDSGDAAGLLYYVMPFVEGESLRERLTREGQLPVDDVLEIAREVADALSYAHLRGLVHRDIKPENILLSGGHAYVADFGIARAVSEARATEVTPTGIAVGTPAYMSPEQASAANHIDARSDLYSLGCVMYEMLTGEPPYTGATAQAIAARRSEEPPRPIRTVRPTVTPQLEATVLQLLAKAPADRFSTASQVMTALPLPSGARYATVVPARQRRRWLAGAAGVTLVAAALVTWRLITREALAPRTVVVFPLSQAGVVEGNAAYGENLATILVTGLNTTDALRGIDGWMSLDPMVRDQPRAITEQLAAHVARAKGARFYVVGRVSPADSGLLVTLDVHDVAEDTAGTLTVRVTRASASVEEVGLTAARRLVLALLPPGRPVDLSSLEGRAPAAVAAYVQGEQSYRRAHFTEALDHFGRAVALDSGFGVAALRGAQAAAWELQYEQATQLIRVAVAGPATLPERYVHFAAGMLAYLEGRADSAVARLALALKLDSTWTDARMQLGEVYFHLLPQVEGLDSLAEATFAWVLEREPGFAPATSHLLEFVARRGDVRRAKALLRTLEAVSADTVEREMAALVVACVERGPQDLPWQDAARRNIRIVQEAARAFTVGGLRQPACARAAWQVLLAHDANPSSRWATLAGMQSVLVALGRTDELVALLRSDTVVRADLRQPLLLLDAFAGAPVEAQAEQAARTLRAELDEGPTRPARKLWMLGIWEARHGRSAAVDSLAAELQLRADTGGEALPRVLARALRGHAALARGDTAAAITYLDGLAPVARKDRLQWEAWQSLGVERITLARLLLARGLYRQAIRTAGAFDAPAAIPFAAFVPASLVIRLRAARASGRTRLAEDCQARLTALGRADMIAGR